MQSDHDGDDSTRTRIQPSGQPADGSELDTLRSVLAGRYRVEREIGLGGMGRVYLATDLALERRVALKTILPAILSDSTWVARFRLEAAYAAGLQHPNLVNVYEILQVRAMPVLVLEYIEGDSLAAAVASGRFGRRDICRIMASVCDGVAHAHAHGVIHCDIKPANILLDRDGVPKVGDFGLAVRRTARPPGQDAQASQERRTLGTPAFMSPEQASGDQSLISDRTDIYSLGATLYYALTGKRPIAGRSIDEVLERVRRGAVEPLGRLAPAIGPDLESICRKAMHRDPALRYNSARELGADLRCALAGLPVSARRYGLLESVGRALRARKESFALGLAVLALMTVGLAGAVSTLYSTANQAVIGQLRRNAMDLASTAVMLVDPALVQAIAGPNPAKLPEARQLAALLNAIRVRSRENVRYVWVMRQRQPGNTRMEFVASSESFLTPAELDKNGDGRVDEAEAPALPGDPFDATPYPELIEGLKAPTADRRPGQSDPWGILLSGYAPVIAADGRSIAVLGVDVAPTRLKLQLAELDRARWIALSVTGALALLSLLLMLMSLVGLWRRSGSSASPRG
jgi:hypothetical protein